LDGANIEIREEAGAENFFLFGLTAEEVARRKREGYDPMVHYETQPDLKAAIELIRSGFFSRGDGSLFRPLVENLLHHDPYMLCADFQSYLDCQAAVDEAYLDPEHWTRMSILNTARSGKFSSDRSIREYCEEIWKVKPVSVSKPKIYKFEN
jgi:starch phosphorylase